MKWSHVTALFAQTALRVPIGIVANASYTDKEDTYNMLQS